MNVDDAVSEHIKRLRDIAPEETSRADQSWERFFDRNAAMLNMYPDYALAIWKTAFYSGHVYSSGDIGVSEPESDTDTH